jgi:hypothetical protein
MKRENKTVSSAALQFVSADSFAEVTRKDGEVATLEMVAYSGKVIPNHWYWGNIAFDLEGIQVPKNGTPILEEHSLNRKVGIALKYDLSKNCLEVADARLLETEAAREFVSNSLAGFPYQASIRGNPLRIEFVEDSASTKVNGHTLKGPGAVWREWELMESSVCVFGADRQTKSKANQHAQIEEQIEYFVEGVELNIDMGGDKMFDIEKFKLENPEGFSEIEASVKAVVSRTLEDQFAQEKSDLEQKIADLKAASQQSGESYEQRLKSLEKDLLLFKEKELKAQADDIFNQTFAGSGLPQRFFGKIERQVGYTQFIKNEVLDVEAYRKALAVEFSDWTEFAVPGEAAVLGSGASVRTLTTEEFSDAQAEKVANDLLASIQ